MSNGFYLEPTPPSDGYFHCAIVPVLEVLKRIPPEILSQAIAQAAQEAPIHTLSGKTPKDAENAAKECCQVYHLEVVDRY